MTAAPLDSASPGAQVTTSKDVLLTNEVILGASEGPAVFHVESFSIAT